MTKPTDQNSNQVNEKSQTGKKEPETMYIKTNGVSYEETRKDANGNGKGQQGRMENIEESPKIIRSDKQGVSNDTRCKLPPTPPHKSPSQTTPAFPAQPKPPVPPPATRPQGPNIPPLPQNVRMAKDLMDDTFKNESVIEKAQTEKNEKEVTKLSETTVPTK